MLKLANPMFSLTYNINEETAISQHIKQPPRKTKILGKQFFTLGGTTEADNILPYCEIINYLFPIIEKHCTNFFGW
jgi:hypothetical protein